MNTWKNIEYDMISNGIVMFGKFENPMEKLQHKVMISFSLSKIKQSDKMKLVRKLYGYSEMKNRKKYKFRGLLEEYGGEKISSNVILIPVEKTKEIRRFLMELGITSEIREMFAK